MLHTANAIEKCKLGAEDGEIGHVNDLLFDDEHWTVRYVVANTGPWLFGRDILISPRALRAVDEQEKLLHVALTRERIERSPDIDTAQPISRQQERDYYGYYGWPIYWGGAGLWGFTAYPYAEPAGVPTAPTTKDSSAEDQAREAEESHLRSANEIRGYYLGAADGEIGHIEDFIIDDSTWALAYLLLDTRNWWPGKRVLVPSEKIGEVSWMEKQVFVRLSRDEIRNAPEYDPQTGVTEEHHRRLVDYYKLSPP